MHNLLTCPTVPFLRANERHLASLPEVYAMLAADDVDSFPGLAAHQAQAWYQFLAQAGSAALHKGGRRELPSDAGEWGDLLADLATEYGPTAWSLIVEDPASPAFLQPPTTEFDKYKPLAETPDELQILVTAKNHDRKQGVAVASSPYHWLLALVETQTMNGFSGRGNYGIARMNGGLSSRVLVDRRPGPRWGPRVWRAIRMLLERRDELLTKRAQDSMFRAEKGLVLSWLEHWDSDEQLSVSDLDPYFIEVCRRIRLVADDHGCISALGRPSNKPRINAQHLKGNLADPWTPINKGEGTALTVGAGGFDYRLAQRILVQRGEMMPPLALKELPGEGDQDTEIHLAVLVRGQGKTEGWHERVVKLPKSIVDHLAFDSGPDSDGEPAPLADHAKEMVHLASEARRVLRQAVLVFLLGPEQTNFQNTMADPVRQRLDRIIDERFFDFLFRAPEDGFRNARVLWQKFLKDEAVLLAREVWNATAGPSVRREKARAASEAVLYGGLRKRLPDAFTSQNESKETAA